MPLCVDLDGTLIKSDMLWETFVRILRQNPFALLAAPWWWMKGRAHLKKMLSARATVDATRLPYHQRFLESVEQQHKDGRKLVLATASDMAMARPVAEHVGLFDEVLASDGQLNLRGSNKVRTLSERYGERGFDYAGNSHVDIPVWAGSRKAVVVNASKSLVSRAEKVTEVAAFFPREHNRFAALLALLRPHQWVKNLILFLPLIASHQIARSGPVLQATQAFVAFCLCASAIYILNDLLDLDADRQHPSKRHRPFAAGDLPMSIGLSLIVPMWMAGLFIGLLLSVKFALVLGLYIVLASAYGWRLKRVALLDVFLLASLYAVRLIAGHEATGVPYSPWLLAFCMSLFVCLALLKRFEELIGLKDRNKSKARGRGYRTEHLKPVAVLGFVAGVIAVVVLAMYVQSEQVLVLYHRPKLLLIACPLLLLWLGRVWLSAYNGRMHSDPVVFALRDPLSYALVFGGGMLVWLATGP